MTITEVNGNYTSPITLPPEGEQISRESTEIVNVALMAMGASPNIIVAGSQQAKSDGIGSADDGDVPELDGADADLAALADMEAFMAYMQMEASEEQIRAAKKRIEGLRAELEKCHEDAMTKIKKAIDEMKKSEKAAKVNRILGWLGVALAFVTAILTTVFTAGAAGPLAFVSAGLALTSMILNETGATEKICKAIADSLQKNGLSKEDAKMAANIIFSSLFMIATLATGIAGGATAASSAVREGINIAESTLKIMSTVSTVMNCTMQLLGLGGSAAGSALSHLAALAQVKVTEHQMTSKELEELMRQLQEEFNSLLEQLDSAVAQLARLLEERQKNEEEIAMQIAG